MDERTIIENPVEPGWYVVCRNLPETSFRDTEYWDGSEWSWNGADVLWHYPQRFATEAEAAAALCPASA